MSGELPSDAPQPRLCHLVKWPDFDGYGFNLHAEKAKSGQFIGKVDDDSPADHASLKEGDRIIEVNGVNIANENHRQVVERIKAVPNETKLLVLDSDADKWYKERKIVVKNSLQNVKYVKTPVPRPTGSNKTEQQSTAANSNGTSSPIHSETQSLENNSGSSTPKTVPKQDSPRSSPASSVGPSSSPASSVGPSSSPASAHKAQNGNSALNNTSNNNSNGGLAIPNGVSAIVSTPPPASRMVHPKPESKPASEDAKATATSNGSSKAPLGTSSNGAKAPAVSKADGKAELNLNMSAAQMREMLANKKKNDPKKQTMDMREKYQIVQQM